MDDDEFENWLKKRNEEKLWHKMFMDDKFENWLKDLGLLHRRRF